MDDYEPPVYIAQPRYEGFMDVNAVAIYYPGLVKVWIPNVPIQKLLPEWELLRSTRKSLDDSDKVSNETNLERSLRRSQRTVSDYTMCNYFDDFGTITIAADRYDDDKSKNKVINFFKNQKKRNGTFQYIVVPERHKDGAFHFHFLMSGYNGKLKHSINTKTSKPMVFKGKPVYELSEYKSGWTRTQKVGTTPEDHARVGSYIRKYITKDMVSEFGRKRFWSSKGLKKPLQEDNPQWYIDLTPDSTYENEYGKLLTFTNLDKKIVPEYVEKMMGQE